MTEMIEEAIELIDQKEIEAREASTEIELKEAALTEEEIESEGAVEDEAIDNWTLVTAREDFVRETRKSNRLLKWTIGTISLHSQLLKWCCTSSITSTHNIANNYYIILKKRYIGIKKKK